MPIPENLTVQQQRARRVEYLLKTASPQDTARAALAVPMLKSASDLIAQAEEQLNAMENPELAELLVDLLDDSGSQVERVKSDIILPEGFSTH